MNSNKLTYLLQHPESINSDKTQQLSEVVNEFPYFQSARAVQLKGLNNSNSYKYNNALKKTATYTVNRKVLFDFITSPAFINETKNTGVLELEEIEVTEAKIVKMLHKKITDTVSKNCADNNSKEISIEAQKASEILEVGKPIQFNSIEPHSFNEWMQLISKKQITRIESSTNSDNKFSLIDKFIETKPKIKPIDKTKLNIDISVKSSLQNESIMTETLAKVYLEQKKYDNAIKAYHILSLKYPEKSGFFADRIKAIKILQRSKS